MLDDVLSRNLKILKKTIVKFQKSKTKIILSLEINLQHSLFDDKTNLILTELR